MFTERAPDSPLHRIGDAYFLLSGVNHRSTPLELRERFSIPREKHSGVLGDLLTHPDVEEAVLLSTCNRTEIVLTGAVERSRAVQRFVEEVFEDMSGVPTRQFCDGLYHLQQQQAVGHLFRVAAGLDSLVVGEPQVLGQLKSAYQLACECGATKELLNRLFEKAFGVAKAVRTQTRIGHNAVSVAYAAKELACQIFGDLSQASVLMLGAGETGALALKHLRSAGCERFFIANRTLKKAASLAEELGGLALDMPLVPEMLPQSDIIIGACQLAQGDSPLVEVIHAEHALRRRKGNPQFYIDLAVPRNIDSAVGELADAFLYNIDDLQDVVAKNIDAREMELRRAELIVHQQVQKFEGWLETREVFPAIRAAREQVAAVQRTEIDKTLRRLRRSGFSMEECSKIADALEDHAQAVASKLLHKPFTVLRERGLSDPALLTSFNEFFVEPQTEHTTPLIHVRRQK